MDLNNFKFDFSGLNFNEENTKKESVEESKKEFDFELAAKKLKEEQQQTESKEMPAVSNEEEIADNNNEIEKQIEKDESSNESVKDTEINEEEKQEVVSEEPVVTNEKSSNEEETKITTEEKASEEEVKPKKKRHRRTKKELAEENVESDVKKTVAKSKETETPAKVIYVDKHENHIENYQECANAMFNNTVDENWNELKETLQNELDKIKITNDINPATLSAMAANIDEAFDTISSYYYSYSSLLEQLTDKDTGKIAYIKGINSIGTNPEDRKRNAWIACASYKENGMNCNLLELVNITRERYNFLLCCYERIKSKQHILFTLTANLKMAAK